MLKSVLMSRNLKCWVADRYRATQNLNNEGAPHLGDEFVDDCADLDLSDCFVSSIAMRHRRTWGLGLKKLIFKLVNFRR
jgi:hypothetical protein